MAMAMVHVLSVLGCASILLFLLDPVGQLRAVYRPTLQVRTVGLQRSSGENVARDTSHSSGRSNSSAVGGKGTCDAYKSVKWTSCKNGGCGNCKNAGARPGVICDNPNGNVGYLCPPDSPPRAFACMDWTFGSGAQRAAESAYNERSGKPPVYFGVGTYGTTDPQNGLGMCVLMHVKGVDRPILAQSINTGWDVSGNQFDLQIGAGGAGAFNVCAGDESSSMFPGNKKPWGHQYGGNDNRSECDGLPAYPVIDGKMKEAGDSLVELCKYGFDKKVRGENGGNPSIQSFQRVACPKELVELTQLQRTDEPEDGVEIVARRLEAEHECKAGEPGATLAWCLTRMMDCRKPSGSWITNTKESLTVPGKRVVQTCTRDGYTRIDVQCGCMDCYC